MKKKPAKSNDVVEMMSQIQEQLAVMNQKLDSFMTKSLAELAQVLAASKPVPRPQVVQAPAPASARPPQQQERFGRTMFAIVCYECGKDSELPFKPSADRPVYCRECFAKRKQKAQQAKAGQNHPKSESFSIAKPGQSRSQGQPQPAAVVKGRGAASKSVVKPKKPLKKATLKKKAAGKRKNKPKR